MLSSITVGLVLFLVLLLATTALFTYSRYQQKEARRPQDTPKKRNFAEEFANDLTPLIPKQRFDHQLPPLPHRYEQDFITLLSRSPYSLYGYWEVSAHLEEQVKNDWDSQTWTESPFVLRFYDITATDNLEEAPYEEYYISGHDDHWYFNKLQPAHKYCFAIGRLLPNRFVPLLISNEAITPADSPSSIIDPEWPPLAGLEVLYEVTNRDKGVSPVTGWGITSPAGPWSIHKKEQPCKREVVGDS
ncbi:DUF4912 domain-containing protein [Heliorestis convoluta]|uniref:DUF4912 domain-containing protein n=1 Tax=Heliorestis convoluta TaxID=356322 RepID=A0A5Q2N1A0_9FIRM|nr:DUF4912 domain-containing protein [Heliorestis convoluta]QGG47589.1 hypothetical protein FTV88_1442 [Heliorestis convoluta]